MKQHVFDRFAMELAKNTTRRQAIKSFTGYIVGGIASLIASGKILSERVQAQQEKTNESSNAQNQNNVVYLPLVQTAPPQVTLLNSADTQALVDQANTAIAYVAVIYHLQAQGYVLSGEPSAVRVQSNDSVIQALSVSMNHPTYTDDSANIYYLVENTLGSSENRARLVGANSQSKTTIKGVVSHNQTPINTINYNPSSGSVDTSHVELDKLAISELCDSCNNFCNFGNGEEDLKAYSFANLCEPLVAQIGLSCLKFGPTVTGACFTIAEILCKAAQVKEKVCKGPIDGNETNIPCDSLFCNIPCPEGYKRCVDKGGCIPDTCPCTGTPELCKGSCVDVQTDVNNCSGCGTSCMGPHVTSAQCINGKCKVLACEPGYTIQNGTKCSEITPCSGPLACEANQQCCTGTLYSICCRAEWECCSNSIGGCCATGFHCGGNTGNLCENG